MKFVRACLATIGALALLAVAGANTAHADPTTVVVHPGDMQGWGFQQETPTGSGTMVNGPATPPAGTGSAELTVDSTGGVVLGTAHDALRFDAIDELAYSTYRQSGGDALAVALQFNVDYDLTDDDTTWQGRLVYEPYHDNTVVGGAWQTWSPLSGSGWWSTQAGNTTCTQADHCTLAEVLGQAPDAGIHSTLGAVLLKAGGGWTGGFVGNVDALTIGGAGDSTTYDFELDPPAPTGPTTKDDCKKGGWETYSDPSFRNQGDCVSFVASGE